MLRCVVLHLWRALDGLGQDGMGHIAYRLICASEVSFVWNEAICIALAALIRMHGRIYVQYQAQHNTSICSLISKPDHESVRIPTCVLYRGSSRVGCTLLADVVFHRLVLKFDTLLSFSRFDHQ